MSAKEPTRSLGAAEAVHVTLCLVGDTARRESGSMSVDFLILSGRDDNRIQYDTDGQERNKVAARRWQEQRRYIPEFQGTCAGCLFVWLSGVASANSLTEESTSFRRPLSQNHSSCGLSR
ncbi:hypothetical protein T265_10169 [Opisthorchis viverrini]|uniref:Uncharacterized protein n=1 Tax=Opisthorchis viverrini TaxID=6198 RepID=A0A074Z7G3_OPIVI|nr:hypothetical protein T265_10169 [Opisthorchis viverrini]KER21522.1 hypothetical protein T265_10169 [Opisthorchis viverrini]